MDDAQISRSKKAAKALKSRVDAIERHLQLLLKKDLVDVYNTLPINEKCQLDVLLTYAINTLYYMYIRTQGQDPQEHAVFNELKRVQRYIEKIKVAEGRGPKPTLKVDKDAAGRFVKAALNSKTSYDTSKTPLNTKKRFPDSDEDDEQNDDSRPSSTLPDQEKQDKNDVKGKKTMKKRPRMDPFSK